jgi:acyl-CoA synthetase (AMP-forming)/AMP-acid ligase II
MPRAPARRARLNVEHPTVPAASANIAAALTAMAQSRPQAPAMIFPVRRGLLRRRDWLTLSFSELDGRSTDLARGLLDTAIQPGARCVVMVKPGPAFFISMFALFKAGLVPVLVDPGIARSALKQCLAEASPTLFLGIPLAHLARRLLGWARASLQMQIVAGPRFAPGQYSLRQLEARGRHSQRELPKVHADDLAAILFTSGSTGVPKGVEYRHRMFNAQVQLLREALDIQPGTVNLPTFPPFALFDPALGQTSVIPEMDARHPARADPRKLLAAIRRFGCTRMFGSPALLKVLVEHAERTGERPLGIRHVLSAGAPVSPQLVERALAVLGPQARIHTPYGATEVLPVTLIEARDLLGAVRAATETGAGICVGRSLPANRVRIIAIDDRAIGDVSAMHVLPNGQIGEITVQGPSVTERYFGRDGATALAKIGGDRAGVIHRMGDLGWLDEAGLLWMVGRKSERVQAGARIWFTECVEQIANADPSVARSALVGIGQRPDQKPVLCIERNRSDTTAWLDVQLRLRALLARYPASSGIETLIETGPFPVDIRHNAKINRAALAQQVQRRV